MSVEDVMSLEQQLHSQMKNYITDAELKKVSAEFRSMVESMSPADRALVLEQGRKNIPNIHIEKEGDVVSTKSTKCVVCEKQNPMKLHCSKCKYVFYCSKACQQSDWKQHKQSCANYATQKAKKKDIIADLQTTCPYGPTSCRSGAETPSNARTCPTVI